MSREDFDLIMRKITVGLNGDPAHDIPYLQQQAQAYKDGEFGREIARACGRLMFDALPEDKKAEFGRLTENNRLGLAAVIEEAQFNMYRRKFPVAEKILSAAVERLEKLNMYRDDAVSEYHTFNSPIEKILYAFLHNPKKTLRQAPEPISDLYLNFGCVLFELKKFTDAELALKKAARWNPIDPNISFEHAEIYKRRGDMAEFYARTIDVYPRAYTKNFLARCYRNLGYYFVEEKLWKPAAACYMFSTHYEPNGKQAQSELWYIQQNADENFSLPSVAEIEQYSEQYKIPLTANRDIVGLALEVGRQTAQAKQNDLAKYFFGIAYDLTESDDIKKMLDDLDV